jgi:hypothetical protein
MGARTIHPVSLLWSPCPLWHVGTEGRYEPRLSGTNNSCGSFVSLDPIPPATFINRYSMCPFKVTQLQLILLWKTSGAISAAIIDTWKWRAENDRNGLFRTTEDSTKRSRNERAVSRPDERLERLRRTDLFNL